MLRRACTLAVAMPTCGDRSVAGGGCHRIRPAVRLPTSTGTNQQLLPLWSQTKCEGSMRESQVMFFLCRLEVSWGRQLFDQLVVLLHKSFDLTCRCGGGVIAQPSVTMQAE